MLVLDVGQTEAFSVKFLAALHVDVFQGAVGLRSATGSLQGIEHALGISGQVRFALGLDEVGFGNACQGEVGIAEGKVPVAELAGEPTIGLIKIEGEELAAVGILEGVAEALGPAYGAVSIEGVLEVIGFIGRLQMFEVGRSCLSGSVGAVGRLGQIVEGRDGGVVVGRSLIEVVVHEPLVVGAHETGLVFRRGHEIAAVKSIGSSLCGIFSSVLPVVHIQIGAGHEQGAGLGSEVCRIGIAAVLPAIIQVLQNLSVGILEAGAAQVLGSAIGRRRTEDDGRSLGIEGVGGSEQAGQAQEHESAKGIGLCQQVILTAFLRHVGHILDDIVGRIDGLVFIEPDVVGITEPPGLILGHLGIGVGIYVPVIGIDTVVAAGHEGILAHHLGHDNLQSIGLGIADVLDTAVQRGLGRCHGRENLLVGNRIGGNRVQLLLGAGGQADEGDGCNI